MALFGPSGASRRSDAPVGGVPMVTPAWAVEQPIVSARDAWPVAGSNTIQSRKVSVVPGAFQVAPPKSSEFEPLSRGPILSSYSRQWAWRGGNIENSVGTTQVPDPIGSGQGAPFGARMVPGPRLTKVLSIPAYTTLPPSEAPTGQQNA